MAYIVTEDEEYTYFHPVYHQGHDWPDNNTQ